MKRAFIAVVLVLAAAAGACGLNPQPFPPDNPDGAVAGIDAAKGGDATFGDAAGNIPDAADSAPVPESDSGSDADASDALVDAPSDAIEDVVLDVSLDVGTD